MRIADPMMNEAGADIARPLTRSAITFNETVFRAGDTVTDIPEGGVVIGRRTSNIFSPVEGLYRMSSVTASPILTAGNSRTPATVGRCAPENRGRPGLASFSIPASV